MTGFTRDDLIHKARLAKASSVTLRRYREEDRQRAILSIRDALAANQQDILVANARDVAAARENELSAAMIDRLTLTEAVCGDWVKL